MAETYAKAGDWAGVHRVAGDKSWAAYDFLRNAYLTRALRGEGRQLERTNVGPNRRRRRRRIRRPCYCSRAPSRVGLAKGDGRPALDLE
jgi:hypothetical protein